ncbi:MAG: tetratricopeptide repeat protein [Candidatus Polarisedimenticolia bacterium]
MRRIPRSARRLACAALVLAAVLPAFAAGTPWKKSIDQLPMYGGVDRSMDPATAAADDKFIAAATQGFGSRRKASESYVEEGARDFRGGDDRMAMRRFNQGWLLDPNNPYAFHGFAIVLHERGRDCDAVKMGERALSLNLSRPITLADIGAHYALCAAADGTLTAEVRSRYRARSKELLQRASEMAPGNDYILEQWGKALYANGDYRGAWEKVRRQRELGGTPDGRTMNLLRAKMPEPN